MQITVKLFANFRNNRFKDALQTVAPDTTVGAIVAELGISEDELGVILINGRHGRLDQVLTDGVTLSLFPLVGGG